MPLHAVLLCSLTILRYCTCTHTAIHQSIHPSIHPSIDLQFVVAAFSTGTPGTNVCPAGSVSVGTEAECTSAATTLGHTFHNSASWAGIPKGCFLAWGIVNFNTHETGVPSASATPICANALTNAPGNTSSNANLLHSDFNLHSYLLISIKLTTLCVLMLCVL